MKKFKPVDGAHLFCLIERSGNEISRMLTNIEAIGGNILTSQSDQRQTKVFGRDLIDTVPPLISQSPFENVRLNLPVSTYHHEIVQLINENQVVLISGETGSLIL